MLGLVYRDGLGVKALSPAWWGKFFQSAASQDHAEAKTQLGKYHYGGHRRGMPRAFS